MRFGLETRTYVNGKPTTCMWCGGKLERLRNIYKGRDSLRYYDSENCLIRGEERAVQRRDEELKHIAAHAGRVNMHWTATLAAILSVLMVAFIATGGTRAWAHEHEGVNYGDWKSSNGVSCCNDSDCQPTRASMDENGNWVALFQGRKVIVPKEKVLSIPSPDGRSHICMSPEAVYPYCFVPGEIRS